MVGVGRVWACQRCCEEGTEMEGFDTVKQREGDLIVVHRQPLRFGILMIPMFNILR